MKSLIKRFVANQDGATAIEYGLIATLLALAIVPAVTGLGTNVAAKFNAIALALR